MTEESSVNSTYLLISGNCFQFHLSSRKTPTWQFSTRPVRPQYCGATPAEWRPRLGKPLSSMTRTGKSSSYELQACIRIGGCKVCQCRDKIPHLCREKQDTQRDPCNMALVTLV